MVVGGTSPKWLVLLSTVINSWQCPITVKMKVGPLLFFGGMFRKYENVYLQEGVASLTSCTLRALNAVSFALFRYEKVAVPPEF